MEKVKNLSALQIVAFAVAIAIMLGLSSFMVSFEASAESVSDIPSSITGTFGNYNAVKFTATTQIFDPSTIFTEFDTKSYIGVFFYEKNGKLTVYDDLFSYVSNGSMFFEFANSRFNSLDDTMFYILKTDRFKDSSSEQAVYFNNYVMLSADKSKFNYSDLEANIPLNVFPNRTVTFDSFSDLYLIFTTTSGILSKSECKKQISDMTADLDKMSVSQWQEIPEGGNENGRFICFGNYEEYTYDEHLADISTRAIYQRNDYNSEVAFKYTAFMFDDDTYSNWVNIRTSSSQLVSYSSTSIAFSYYNDLENISSVKLRISMTLLRPTMRESDNPFDIGHYFVTHHANQHYSRYVLINGGSLSAIPAKSTGTFKINLQGYCNMNFNSYYLLELVDGKTSDVLSSVMFLYTGKDTFKIDGSNNKNGEYISVDYEYEKGNSVIDKNITPDVDGVLPDLINGSKDETFVPIADLSNIDITDIFSSLNQATASVGAFFQATLNIIPISFMTLILGSLALLIVLRILGR